MRLATVVLILMRFKKLATFAFLCSTRFVKTTIASRRIRPSAQALVMVKVHNHPRHPTHTEATANNLTGRVMGVRNLPAHQLLRQVLQVRQALVAQGRITVHSTPSITVARIPMLHTVGIRTMLRTTNTTSSKQHSRDKALQALYLTRKRLRRLRQAVPHPPMADTTR